MSGHSKWAQIKRKKGANDTKRGQAFTRLARDITIAVREGGSGDPDSNFSLRLAVDKARGANMPKDNIERAIQRGLGNAGDGGQLEDISYEAYGPGGTALIVQVLTDNRNRAAAEVRRVITRGGANFASAGSVAWMFDKRGIFTIPIKGKSAEDLELELIDAGVDDIQAEDESIEAYVAPEHLRPVRDELQKRNIPIEDAQVTLIPKNPAAVSPQDAAKTMQLIEDLEELDDVQKVISNLDITDEAMAEFEKVTA
ncbi:MAG: YebC/PmpR family DNA-binding transcriptional regulator [Chloroflexota bacterium]|nr:MAG: YebC/PmpR family DNA-binding transcriptional regulator [Chloroflexota bacterium]